MKNPLLEATRIHHGSIKDLQTFLDQDGNPMALEQTSLDDLMNAAKERGKSRQTNSDGDELNGPEAPGGKDSSSSKTSDETPTGDNEGPAEGSGGEDEEDDGDVGPDPNFKQPDFDYPEEPDPWAVPDDDLEGDGDGPDNIPPDDYDEEGENKGQGKGSGKSNDGKEGDSEGEGEGEGKGENEQKKPQSPSESPKMPKNPKQQKPQEPRKPEFRTPEKGQMFRDVMTGKTYKWDGKKFVIQR